jgi:hypothetical protein
MTVAEARIIHVSIDVAWRTVYDFASRPENMPLWAAGLAAGLTAVGDGWTGDGGPLGQIRVDFVPRNDFGAIDHDVTLPDGRKVHNAFRILPNVDGAEAVFTLIRQADMNDAAFEADAAAVRADLETLKSVLEKR